MKWSLAGVLASLIIELSAPPADACGVKLIVKTSTPRKSVARSSNPSNLLLVGKPPNRMERELAAAGHNVEVAPSLKEARRSSYAVVVVDAKQANETRSRFPGTVVVVRSGNVVADISSVESQVARRPVKVDESRPVVAARARRQPIAAGPDRANRPVVAAKEPSADPEAPAREPAGVTTTVPPPPVEQPPARQPAPVEQAPDRQPRTVARAPAAFRGSEIHFGLSKAAVAGKSAALDRVARRLTENPSLSVVIEGHADPSGDPSANMTLSQSRAEAVRDYLVAAGIDQGRLEVAAFGDTRLKYGRADGRNRRVVILPKP
jgi:outer membrane protein OmpA-like peptidoglycan-associated protein